MIELFLTLLESFNQQISAEIRLKQKAMLFLVYNMEAFASLDRLTPHLISMARDLKQSAITHLVAFGPTWSTKGSLQDPNGCIKVASRMMGPEWFLFKQVR